MANLSKKVEKLGGKLKKTRKHSKKRAHDSLGSDFDSDQDSGYSSPINHVDKRLKLNKPSGIDLKSTDARPIKATRTALDIFKANEITIENSKTGKVTAVVVIMKVFGSKIGNSRNKNVN